MPYIKKNDREHLGYIDNVSPEDFAMMCTSPGELNYLLTCILLQYAAEKGISYSTYNEIIGVLECCKLEFYRRACAPYEEEKIKENGDVY